MKRLVSVLLIAIIGFVPLFASGQAEEEAAAPESEYSWQPDRPINLIVPWGAGGGTDRTARATIAVVEEHLGQTIVVVNQPGAAGSVGTQATLDAPADGYTWTAGAVKDLGNYVVQGMLDTTLDEWELYLNFAIPNVVAVNVDTPYETFDDLLAAFEANPGEISVATAGVNSAGHTAIELIRNYTGIEYQHVTYDGGNPAVIATVGGETEVVTQLSGEQVDMIRAGQLRPLAVLADRPLAMAGVDGEVPPITNWIPDFESAPINFGIFVPSDVPSEVIETLDMIWAEHVADSEELAEFAADNAMVFDPAYGEEALAKSMPMVRMDAWLKYDAGDAVINPSEVGYERP